LRIALVDDAAVSRALFVRIAVELGHVVVVLPEATQHDGVFGLAALAEEVRVLAPEIVILDGRLGDPLGRDGEAAARCASAVARLHAAAPAAAIGVVAALAETALLRAAVAAGASFVLPRPYLRSQLRATLAMTANERRLAPAETSGEHASDRP